MGGCVRKPILVYQSILIECYDMLEDRRNPAKHTVKSKSYQQRQTMLLNGSSEDESSQQTASRQRYIECSEDVLKIAAESFATFNKRDDLTKLESQIKLHARTLSDHIQDTHLRLIDTMIYLRQKLLNDICNYGEQWATILILEVLVDNLKNYTQKHISLKHIAGDESIVGSKHDNLTEIIDILGISSVNDNKPTVVSGGSVQQQPQQQHQHQQQQQLQQQQITFFSDNFIRFEMDFIEISLFLLNCKANPFFIQSQSKFLKILHHFSSIHKDHYTSDRIASLVDLLEDDIQSLVKSIQDIPSLVIERPGEMKQRIDNLTNLMRTYVATIAKVRINQKVFKHQKQLAFLFFVLQTTIEFNKIKQDAGAGGKKSRETTSLIDSIDFLTATCLRVVAVFARRSFILKTYNSLVSSLFAFFDQVRWNVMLPIEGILEETIAVAKLEAVYLNYKIYLMEQLVEYLSLSKSSGVATVKVAHAPRFSLPLNINAMQEMDSVIVPSPTEQLLVNFSESSVKIRVLQIFDKLVRFNNREVPLFSHFTARIMRCYLENLRDATDEGASLSPLRDALNRSFKHYVATLATDTNSLVTTINILTSEICESISTLSVERNSQMHINFISTPKAKGKQQQIIHTTNVAEPFSLPASYQLKFVMEGILLVHIALDSARPLFHQHTGGYFASDELIMDLLFVSNTKRISLLTFSAIAKVATLLSSERNDNDSAVSQMSSIIGKAKKEVGQTVSISVQYSYHTLLHVLFQAMRCVYTAMSDGRLAVVINTAIIFEYVRVIIADVMRKGSVLHVRVVVAFLEKLIQEAATWLKAVYSGGVATEESPLRAVKLNHSAQHLFTNVSATQTNNIQAVIYEIIKLIDESAATSLNNSKIERFPANLRPPKLDEFCQTLTDLVDEYRTHFDHQLIQLMKGGSDTSQKLQLIERLAEKLEKIPLIENAQLENGKLLKTVVEKTNKLGVSPEQNYDAMTAQLSRNFSKNIGDLEIANVYPDEEAASNDGGGRITIEKKSFQGSEQFIERKRFDEKSEAYDENDDEDSQFGNILNMIQRKNPAALPNLNQ